MRQNVAEGRLRIYFWNGAPEEDDDRLGVLNEIVGFVMSDCPFGERVACIGVQ